MALRNASYDSIEDEYTEIRRENDRLYTERLMKIYKDHPDLKAADERIDDILLKKAFKSINDEDYACVDAELAEARSIREGIIAAAGVDPEYLERIYTCPICKDRGYIESEDRPAEKCKCFRKRESEILLRESGMREMLKKNNFSVMRTDIYAGETQEHFLKAVELCRSFIDSFDSDYRNILFCGTVGTGKSFLSACIASELLASYHSVLYMSAKTLFDSLAEAQFSKGDTAEADAIRERIYDCELLIIDDLGTEMTNSFVGTELFTIINERFNSKKSVIISTNLELSLLRDRYSDRIFSRLTGSYDIIKMDGPDLRRIL